MADGVCRRRGLSRATSTGAGGKRIDFPYWDLTGDGGYPWDGEIATLPITGSFMTEVEFFHRPSRTLILTDLIEYFEPGKLRGVVMPWLTRLGGVQDPHGGMPRDMRLTFSRTEIRAAIETMIGWNPERVIIAHGRWYEQEGASELRRAFKWVLD